MHGAYHELSQQQEFVNYTATQARESADEVAAPMSKSDQTSDGPSPRGADPDTIMDLTRRTGDLKVYYYYIQNIMLPIGIGFIVVNVLVASANNFPQVWLNWWTHEGGQQLSLYLSVYSALAVAASTLSVLSIWVVFLNLMPQAASRLHQILLKSVIHAPLSFFASTDTGVTLNRFSQDMSLVDLALPIALTTAVSSLFDCIAKVALISTRSSYMAIMIP
jgi:ATP-binding cassette subfamily C (CFTR/MRP) protein 1